MSFTLSNNLSGKKLLRGFYYTMILYNKQYSVLYRNMQSNKQYVDSWDVHVARVGEGVGLLIRPRFRILLMIACIVQKIKPSALSTCFRGITESWHRDHSWSDDRSRSVAICDTDTMVGRTLCCAPVLYLNYNLYQVKWIDLRVWNYSFSH